MERAKRTSVFYSPTSGGFFRSSTLENLPASWLEIPPELHQELIDGQSRGKKICPPDADHPLPWLADRPGQTVGSIIRGYERRIEARLNAFARSLSYNNILSACTYATSAIELYRIEGQYCVNARDATWAKAYELLSAFREGDPIPTWEEVEAQLPPLVWPEGSRGYKPEVI